MVIDINDQQIDIPTSLLDITIQQRIDYAVQYGDELDKQLAVIQEMKDEQEKEIVLTTWWQDKIFKELSFFIGIPLQALENSDLYENIQTLYFLTLAGLIENE